MTTLQELFNKAYLGVVGQGGFARNLHGSCYYTLGEKHCAAGWLLTKEQQQHLIDLGLNSKPFERVNRELNMVPVGLELFVCAMQRVHDNCERMDEFILRMKNLAERNNLTVPEVPA